MNLSTKLITPPAAEPVALNDMKTFLKVPLSFTGDDTMIEGMIVAARVQAEVFTSRAFLTQEWEQYFDSFPRSGMLPERHTVEYSQPHHHWYMRLLRPPLQTIEFIKYIDANGTLQTLDSSLYVVDAASESSRVTPAFGKFWPPSRLIVNAITVRYKAGFGDTVTAALDAEPKFQQAIMAIMFLVAHWYSNREPVVAGQVVTLPLHVQSLLYALDVHEFH